MSQILQFTGDVAMALVKPHRRLIRSKKMGRGTMVKSFSCLQCAVDLDFPKAPESYLLLFLFNDILLGARIRTKILADGTMTPVKRRQGQVHKNLNRELEGMGVSDVFGI
eukprot:748888-Hanusia_phi.AAC.5